MTRTPLYDPYAGQLAGWLMERENARNFTRETLPNMDEEDVDWLLLGLCAQGYPEKFWERMPKHLAMRLLASAPKYAGPIECTTRGTRHRSCLKVYSVTLLEDMADGAAEKGWTLVDE